MLVTRNISEFPYRGASLEVTPLYRVDQAQQAVTTSSCICEGTAELRYG
jgi:hypothetical protein